MASGAVRCFPTPPEPLRLRARFSNKGSRVRSPSFLFSQCNDLQPHQLSNKVRLHRAGLPKPHAHNSHAMPPPLRVSGESRITLTPRISATSPASAIMSDALLLVS